MLFSRTERLPIYMCDNQAMQISNPIMLYWKIGWCLSHATTKYGWPLAITDYIVMANYCYGIDKIISYMVLAQIADSLWKYE